MAHQFDSGLFVNSDLHKEWHGLGKVIDTAPKTTAEAMTLAGMDWTVDESPVITMAAAGAKPILVPGWKCLTRSDNKEVLHVAKDTWTPVQNSEAFAWFDPFIQDGDASISAAVSLAGGKRIAITAKLKDGIGDVTNGDPIEAYLLLFNSHDGTLCLGSELPATNRKRYGGGFRLRGRQPYRSLATPARSYVASIGSLAGSQREKS